jgi:hypothetical protein
MLLRKGWGIFGPLPLGGDRHDLSIARLQIENMISVKQLPSSDFEESE